MVLCICCDHQLADLHCALVSKHWHCTSRLPATSCPPKNQGFQACDVYSCAFLLTCIYAVGEFKLSKVRKVPGGNRSRAASPFFWRYSVYTATCQLLTDRPVTDLVLD